MAFYTSFKSCHFLHDWLEMQHVWLSSSLHWERRMYLSGVCIQEKGKVVPSTKQAPPPRFNEPSCSNYGPAISGLSRAYYFTQDMFVVFFLCVWDMCHIRQIQFHFNNAHKMQAHTASFVPQGGTELVIIIDGPTPPVLIPHVLLTLDYIWAERMSCVWHGLDG